MNSNHKSNFNNDGFKEQKIAANMLKAASENLNVRDVVLYLNEMVINILNIYKKHNNMNFSETMNMFCEKNLNELEMLFSTDHRNWLSTLDDYVNLSSLKKAYSNVVMDYLYLPQTRYDYKRQDVHILMDKNHIDRIDELKNHLLFKKASRDTIITYLMCLDNFNDIGDIFKESVLELFSPFVLELTRCRDSIEQNYIKINKTLIGYLFKTGFVKPDTLLILRYIDETLDLYRKDFEKNKSIVINKEFEESIVLVKNLLYDQNEFLKKNNNALINNYIKTIEDKLVYFDFLFN